MNLRRLLALALAAVAAGCAARPPVAPALAAPCAPARPFAEGGERATLWVRQSAEYRAASETIYRAARSALAANLADPGLSAEHAQRTGHEGLPPAVVMDIDETVLDNSAAQARMILEVTCPAGFAPLWDAWLAERAAPAVPGAVEFIRAARAMADAGGRPVRVFFITNRECAPRAGSADRCPQQADTLANLRALGLDAPMLAEDLMLKSEQPGWPSEKESRRLELASRYRIVLNIGDDFGDFLPGVRRLGVAERARIQCEYRDWWGTRWFLVPNPMYGSWQSALGPDPGPALAEPPPAQGCPEA